MYLTQPKSDERGTSSGPGLHDTNPSEKETKKPAEAACSRGENLRPMQPQRLCIQRKPKKNANLRLKHTTGFARHHPLGEGHVQATRRRQGQQLYAWYGTPSRRPQAAPPFPLTPAGEVIQPKPPALPPEAWPSECNTNKAKQSKREVFLNTTHC